MEAGIGIWLQVKKKGWEFWGWFDADIVCSVKFFCLYSGITFFKRDTSQNYYINTKTKLMSESLTPNELEKRINEFLLELEKFQRPAFLPQTKETKREFSSKSKFGGYPYLRTEEDWAKCPTCKKQMHLFVQIDLSNLPINKENGLIQLFYCLDDHQSECRKINISGKSKETKCELENPFPEKQITGWKAEKDYPHFEEYWILGIERDDEIENEISWFMEENEIGSPLRCDKLFGWPYWEQDARYPINDSTGENMEMLFQIISEENLPYTFGDDGIFHIMYDNKDEKEYKLDTTWSCG